MARNYNLPMRHRQDAWLMPPRENELWSPDNFLGASPWQMMHRMREEMDRLFGDLMSGGGAAVGTMPTWNPSIDVSEDNNEYCIEIDLPGVKPDNIQVDAQGGQITIHAEVREGTGMPNQQQPAEGGVPPQEQRQYHRRERRYGSFTRSFPLPDNVVEEQIRCDFRDGVLTCHLPKSEQHRSAARRIPVGGASPQLSTAQGPQENPAKEDSSRGQEKRKAA